jgi:hypothetical protein
MKARSRVSLRCCAAGARLMLGVQDHPTKAVDELLPGAWAAARDET